MPHKIYLYTLLSLVFFFPSVLFPQKTEFKYIHKFSVKEGLSSYNIRKIIKDEYNYIWIATQEGLNRFDGTYFFRYTSSSKGQFQLKASDIRDLASDPENHLLWVLTNIDGIFQINTTTGNIVAHVEIPYTTPDDWTWCFKNIDSLLWIGGSDGLKILNTKTKTWTTAPAIPFGKNSKEAFEIGSITEDAQKNIWVFVNGHGVVIYSPAKKNILAFETEENLFSPQKIKGVKYNSPVQLTDSLLITGTNNGLVLLRISPGYSLTNITKKFKAIAAVSSPVFTLAKGAHNSLFVGLADKTIRLDSTFSTTDIIRDKDGESENSNWLGQVKTIIDDGEFTWLGSKEGLAYTKSKSFANEIYSSRTAEFSAISHVYDIEPLNNQLLVGGKNGLYLINRETKKKLPVKPNIIVNNLLPGFTTEVIVSTTSGNYLFKNSRLIPLHYQYPELRNYDTNVFLDNLKLNDSIMLVSTDDESGIIVWNYKSRRTHIINTVTSPALLGSKIINGMYKDSGGRVWVLGDKALTIIDKDLSGSRVIKIRDKNTNREPGPLFDATETNEHYWLCSYGTGLIQLNKSWEVLKVYDETSGLTNSGVYKIFNPDNSKLFITSNNGLTILDIKSGKTKKIYEEAGLHANTFEEAAGCLKHNEIFSGGPNGFSVISADVPVNADTPVVHINRIAVQEENNFEFSRFSNELISVSISQHYTQAIIYCSGINYSNPARTTFQYKINELHKDWINLGAQNFITLIGIPPGTYHLQVQAFNEDGIPSGIKGLTLLFHPKWYQTWWFKLALALLFTASLYALYRLRVNQLKKEQDIRSKLASDLHDDLGSTLNSVKVYANLALMNKDRDKYLGKIKESVQEAVTGVKDMIWVLDDSKDTVEHLLSRISQFASPLCEANKISYRQTFNEEARDHILGRAEKRNLYMILKEAVNNACKYSGAGEVTVEILVNKKRPDIHIHDNGKGFDLAAAGEGNGLKNMQLRARQIRYAISLASSPGNGTHIRLQKT